MEEIASLTCVKVFSPAFSIHLGSFPKGKGNNPETDKNLLGYFSLCCRQAHCWIVAHLAFLCPCLLFLSHNSLHVQHTKMNVCLLYVDRTVLICIMGFPGFSPGASDLLQIYPGLSPPSFFSDNDPVTCAFTQIANSVS